MNVQRNSQDLQHQGQSVERIKHTLFDEVQRKVTHLDERLRMVVDHIEGITKTIDKNSHSKCASITAMISEQEGIRRLVEELAKRLDQPQEVSGRVPSESGGHQFLIVIGSPVLRMASVRQEWQLPVWNVPCALMHGHMICYLVDGVPIECIPNARKQFPMEEHVHVILTL